MTAIRENGGTLLASYGYDDDGRRTSRTLGNGLSTSYGYDAVSRLTSLTTSGSGGNAVTLSDYSPAGQIGGRSSSNDAYAWTQAMNVNRGYGSNGLNQYNAITGVSPNPTYDPRGNLTSAGSTTYSYSAENELALAGSTRFYYDALHRLVYGTSDSQRMDNDGASLAAEYNSSGTLNRRYVWGPGTDEIVLWYDDNGTGQRRWADLDERNSTTRITNDAGGTLWINSYDEYGIPGPNNLGRIQYTGQQWRSDLGMSYFKARIYSPTLGRFLQTDPIGYDDGLNWYAYVGGDPINATDPSGTCTGSLISQSDGQCYGGGFVDGAGFSSGYFERVRPNANSTLLPNGAYEVIPSFRYVSGSIFGSLSLLSLGTSSNDKQPICPSGARANVGGGVSATGFLGVLGLSGGISVNVSVPTASLSNFSLRGIQVSISGSITPLAGLGLYLGAGPSYSAGGSSGASRNLSVSVTPTIQAGAGDGAGVEIGTDFTSPTAGSVAVGRIAGGAYAGVGARFSATTSTNPIGCRSK